MRLRLPGGRDAVLTYCANVHAVEDPEDALEALGRFTRPVGDRLGVDRFVVGLWLSRRSADRFDGPELEGLREALDRSALDLVTLNGFPYGDFHAERVKEAVYRPDWSEPARTDYTRSLARILDELLPADIPEGTISTLPLTDLRDGAPERVLDAARELVRLASELDRLAQSKGRSIRVCLEPEPHCALEATDQAIRFFTDELPAAAKREGVTREIVDRHLGLCFDACHQATAFEDPVESWRAIQDAGIVVGKVQLSCALEVRAETIEGARKVLEPFDEARFLHQVRCRRRDGRVERWLDLGEAFDEGSGEGDWRVHFHVPLDWTPERGALATTRPFLERLLPEIAKADRIPHLEVETYTWNVLPEALRPRDDATLVQGIAREVDWARARLLERC